MTAIVLLHAGAGYHSVTKEASYGTLCAEACRKGQQVLSDGGNAQQAVVEVMKILENSSLTNAGYGSSLTVDASVECDASIMTSDGYFGAVAAVQRVPNPIAVVSRLLDLQHISSADGRIPPSFLAGVGAERFAEEQGIPMADPSSLISEGAKASYNKYIKIVERHQAKKRTIDNESDHCLAKKKAVMSQEDGRPLDTVGVICVDRDGRLACALSSGGIALKRAGRVGQAAVIGSGCWVDERVAVATTGCGEQLMRTMLAKTLADSLTLAHSDDDVPHVMRLDQAMKQSFLGSSRVSADPDRFAGAIIVQLNECKSQAELMWTHTTKSMCISYMTTGTAQPTTFISRLSDSEVSQVSTCSGVTINRHLTTQP